jgi:protein TonB
MPLPAPTHTQRRLLIVAAVVVFHIAGLWALQSGLLRRAVETVIPVQVLADWVEAPQPEVSPPAPAPAAQPSPANAPAPKPTPTPQATHQTAPTPPALTVAEPTPNPAPEAPSAVLAAEPQPPAWLAAASEPAPAPPAPPAPPTPARIELPSSNADYLDNPRPAYPALSRRLGEQGTVVVRVFIEANGKATKAEIRSSSGFERLDQSALQTVLTWRYVPGKRNGVAEAMWFNVPISFVLK